MHSRRPVSPASSSPAPCPIHSRLISLSRSQTSLQVHTPARPACFTQQTIPFLKSSQPNPTPNTKGYPCPPILLNEGLVCGSVRCTACTVNCSHSYGHTRWAVLASNAMSADYELGRPTSYTYVPLVQDEEEQTRDEEERQNTEEDE